MGAALCKRNTAAAIGGTMSVAAPILVVEAVFQDLESLPRWSKHILSVEIKSPDKRNGLDVGVRWKEVRLVQGGRKTTFNGTVTDVQRDETTGAIKVTTSYDWSDVSWNNKDAAEISVVTITPRGEEETELEWRAAFVSSGFFGRLSSAMVLCCMPNYIYNYTQAEWESYAAEAVRRWQEQQQ